MPWLAGLPQRVGSGAHVLVDEEGLNFVSLKIWRPRQALTLPSEPLDAAWKVVETVVRDAPEANARQGLKERLTLPDETGGTVIEALTPIIRSLDEDLQQVVSAAFDRCLEELGLLIRAYAVHAKDARVKLLSRRNVYPLIPYALRDPFADPPHQILGLFLAHEGVGIVPVAPTELDEVGVRGPMVHVSRIKQGDPLHVFMEQAHRARRAYWVEGDFAGAVIATHTSGEVLLRREPSPAP